VEAFSEFAAADAGATEAEEPRKHDILQTVTSTRAATNRTLISVYCSHMRPLAILTVSMTAMFAALTTRAGQDGAALARAARLRQDISTLETVLPKAADRGAALYMLARRHAELGEEDRAQSILVECLSLDEGFEPDIPALAGLQKFPEVHQAAVRFRGRHPPVHKAAVAFTVGENDLFPEGLAYDPGRRAFYLSSEHHNKIVRVDEHRQVSDFVPDDRYHLAPVGGLRVDPADQSLWAATDSAEFVHVDRNGELVDRFSAPDPDAHIMNDLVVRRAGEVYVTDTRGHLVFRLNRASRQLAPVQFHRPLLYPNGITLSPDEQLVFVADDLGVIVLDLRTGHSFDVRPGRNTTLAGIDGLYWHKGDLVGVQYGTGAYRVMRWRLSPDSRAVISSAVLEYRTNLVDFPTTGAIVDDDFYFIANTGIGNLEHGRIVDRAKLEPVRIAVVKLN
jgi:hypothetical protein